MSVSVLHAPGRDDTKEECEKEKDVYAVDTIGRNQTGPSCATRLHASTRTISKKARYRSVLPLQRRGPLLDEMHRAKDPPRRRADFDSKGVAHCHHSVLELHGNWSLQERVSQCERRWCGNGYIVEPQVAATSCHDFGRDRCPQNDQSVRDLLSNPIECVSAGTCFAKQPGTSHRNQSEKRCKQRRSKLERQTKVHFHCCGLIS
mmetsp:Transcript_8675/g.25653  ORF Transcript_8675/g.25653 Transcript_8675/m.25653 type:complete len:204 (-) Transcript_8675:129-740(-)